MLNWIAVILKEKEKTLSYAQQAEELGISLEYFLMEFV
jgi:hypothetical protein